ncbi:MAG: PEGA domain-containing protein, partial [Kiritimatiellae bacterium]|nr:PEGA domain-containing protein [Kiritimatiellia bacterium]
VRELALNAGDRQELALVLEGLPGTLRLTSVPEGARFYVNDAAEGKGPVTLVNLRPGTYKVRCELEGYATVLRDVTLANGATASEEFRLMNVMGSLEVRTTPPGATLILDGHAVGTTRSADPAAEKSDVLILPNLSEGEHTLVVRKDGYAEVVRHPAVAAKSASRVTVALKRLFIPNIEIETPTGIYRGVLVENTAAAVMIETSPGVSRLFPRAEIRRIDVIDRALRP